jgi:mitosis inhibitor protein kinase SWE1
VHLKKHTETMTKLRICDLDDSDEEDGVPLFSRPSAGNRRSTGYAADSAKTHGKVVTSAKGNVKAKSTSLGRSLGASLLAIAQNKTRKGKGKNGEVVEAISPGGHITKRRARSRPVSQELLESVVGWTPTSPSPGPVGVFSS